MSRLRRLPLPFEEYDEDFEDDSCSNSSKNGNPPIQRNAANARERARMRVLSSAFGRLKTKLPNIPPDTKLSKLDTLRLATIYIKQLKTLAEGDTDKHRSENNETSLQQAISNNLNSQNCAPNMTWPFAFQHIHTTNRQLAMSSQLSTNWHPPEEFEDKLKTNENAFSCNHETSNAANAFQNKGQLNISAPDINNCLFDCIQQQQHLNYYINRSNHHNYPLPDCADHQNQNTEIH